MKIKEIRLLSTDELKKKLFSLYDFALNQIRIKKETGQLEHNEIIKKNKKTIARIYTVLREREFNNNK